MTPPTLRLVVDKGPSAGAEVTLSHRPVTIGRGPGHDLVLEGDEFVSSRHARIVCDGSKATLTNQSANGTLVNGRSVTEVTLAAGDLIAVGVMHLITVRAVAGADTPGRVRTTSSLGPQKWLKLPVWLMAYLALIAIAFVFFAVKQVTRTAAPGLSEIRAQEQQFAAGRRYPGADTDRVLRLLDTAVVHERRGDPRSAYEAYRETMSVRRPIDARSPAYRYAASRAAALGAR